MKDKKDKTMKIKGPGGKEYYVPVREPGASAAGKPLLRVQGAKGMVLPKGSIPPVASLESGEHVLKILDVHKGHLPLDEEGNPEPQTEEVMKAREANPRWYVEVEYPDGWVREHHALDLPDLLEKVVNNIQARYGAGAVNIVDAPGMSPGKLITVEV